MSYINIGDFTSGKQDYWSWAHLKSFVGQDEAAEHFYAGGPYFAWNWNMFLYTCLVVTTIYTFIGWLSKHTNLVERSSKPQGMSDLNVFLLATHITFAILFTAQVFPYTYCAFHFYFTTYGLNDWTIP